MIIQRIILATPNNTRKLLVLVKLANDEVIKIKITIIIIIIKITR